MTKYEKLRNLYKEYFSTGYLALPKDEKTSPFEKKLILISLICYITYKYKQKNPDITHYEVIRKLSVNTGISEDFAIGLSILCEDLSYNCTEFPTFGLKGNDIVKEVKAILNTYLPF
jgi:hypothetical protein